MTTSKITEITMSCNLGEITTSDPALIAQISDYLKHNLTATPSKEPEIVDSIINPDTPSSLYDVTIQFDSGVKYWGHGYGEYEMTPDPGGSTYYLYSSDLGQTIVYTLSEGSAAKLRQYIIDLSQNA